ncbi:MAG: 23S rRNA pseudouridine(1911/1915/1917) synthase RluD [Gammaproteobacteria bacterium]|nr:23S rRNA pseudouridine(1911/1915/1917) synthase RluD [Gammaproteobacteria bacterium]
MQKPTFVVPPELGGKRLDQALALLCPEYSRARLQSWIRGGRVTVDGGARRQRDPVRAGEHIILECAGEPPQAGSVGQDIPLDVLYEDRAIIVVNKPAGLVVHPGAGNPDRTLMNALLHHAPELQGVPRAGIVQRLDKDTSGIMVIARTLPAHTWLVRRLKDRKVRREYRAIVIGTFAAGGRIDAPIGRHRIDRKRMAVAPAGRPAVTHYRILQRFRAHSYLQVILETGRTHQIRVHLAHIRHPVVGDRVYGGQQPAPKNLSDTLREALRAFPRQALHASDLSLAHPETGKEMKWSAPPPFDMQTLLKLLADEP